MAFRPGIGLTLLTAGALAVLLTLGTWQVQRLNWKADLIQTLERQLAAPVDHYPAASSQDASMEFRPFSLTGNWAQYISPQRYRAVAKAGVPGHHVLAVLEADGGAAVLVDLGWLASKDAERLSLPTGPVTLEGAGLWLPGTQKAPFTPENEPAARQWYWLDLEALDAALGVELAPLGLRASAVSTAATVDPAPVPQALSVDLPNNHLGYAVTWYGLAAGLVGVYLAFGFNRGRNMT